MQEPAGEAKATAPGAFASNFGAEFDGFVRQAYARSVDQAREFVAFVTPEPGSAVVEVGAGSGRITFDGGLAEAVGRQGRLLVTDPSSAQLDVARRRAADLGHDWVRFLCAPVEALPVAPETADLCLGALFLHFTEPADAVRAMARTVHPGGRVAICAMGEMRFSPAWREVFEPAFRLLEARGLSFDVFPPREALERIFREAGLTVDAVQETVDRLGFPTVDIAIGVLRQTKWVPLMLRRLPADESRGAERAVEARLRDIWKRTAPEDLVSPGTMVSILGRR